MIEFEPLVGAVLAELGRALRSVDQAELAQLRQMIRESRRVFVAGRGRSGLQLSAFAMRLMHLGLPVHVVGEVTTPGIAAGDLLLIGSGSGRTTSLVQYAEHAHSLKAPVALITTAASSPIGEKAACCIRIEASTPKFERADAPESVLPMGSLFEQSLGLLLDLLVVQLMDDLHLTADQMFARHANLE